LENDEKAASAAAINPARIIRTNAMPSWSQSADVIVNL
jgi:hypothetical protein